MIEMKFISDLVYIVNYIISKYLLVHMITCVAISDV